MMHMASKDNLSFAITMSYSSCEKNIPHTQTKRNQMAPGSGGLQESLRFQKMSFERSDD